MIDHQNLPSGEGRETPWTPGPWRVEEGTTLVWGACNPDDQTTYGMGYPVAEAVGRRYQNLPREAKDDEFGALQEARAALRAALTPKEPTSD